MLKTLAIGMGALLIMSSMAAPASATWMNRAIESQKSTTAKAPKATKKAKKAKAPKRKAATKKN